MTRQPPSLPTNKGLFVSSEDSVPATPGQVADASDDGLQRGASLARPRPGDALRDQENAVGEGRTETLLELGPHR